MLKLLTRFSTYTLLVALSISAVAEFYSIVGLTAIFAAAVIPTIIMGVVLGLGKLTGTVWLKLNWERAPFIYKLYLIPAILVLMFLTSMGIFGFLSKAHSDQSLVSGDSQAKIAVYEEKIKVSKENIDVNRKALKQLDEAVDQVMGRSTSESGADKAVQVRRSQANDRRRLLAEITAEQKTISQLSEEVAPLKAENRKIEAEVGPIKYIAAMIYGDNPDANLLEKAVRVVIIIIVSVFDPLALMLLLAAQQSMRWEREREQQEEEDGEKEVEDFFTRGKLVARGLDADEEARLVQEANDKIAEIEPEEPAYEMDDGPINQEVLEALRERAKEELPTGELISKSSLFEESDPAINCYKCGTELMDAPGIGPFCPNKECDVIDGPFSPDEEPITITYRKPKPLTVDSDVIPEPEIETENVTEEKILYSQKDGHITFDGKKMSFDNLRSIRPDLILPLDGVIPNTVDFGIQFPKLSLSGDTYIRTDSMPHRVYKFNGVKWMNVDKEINTTYLTNTGYIKYLIHQLEVNKYDPELLTYAERDEIEAFLDNKWLTTINIVC